MKWTEELHPALSIDIYRELAHSVAARHGLDDLVIKIRHASSDEGLIALLMSEEDPRVLGDSPSPKAIELHAARRQVLAFFQKIEPLSLRGRGKEILEGEALVKFLATETRCKETNELLKLRRIGKINFPPIVENALKHAQSNIASVLGKVPALQDLDFRFGSGATSATIRADCNLLEKVLAQPACSHELVPYVAAVLSELPHLSIVHSVFESETRWLVPVEIHQGRVQFVPKNWKSLRTVTTEPPLNVIVQLGYNRHLVKRMERFGLMVRDQSVNQRRALMASIHLETSTLDLSSASDLTALELLRELLSFSDDTYDWFIRLVACRCGMTVLPDGQTILLEKYAGMGNATTFPIEMLIFWALAQAVCPPGSVTVYGDDIICPTASVPDVILTLETLGFLVNRDKSFFSGSFRESCGHDYCSGINVRPVYPRKWVSGEQLFTLHNFFSEKLDFCTRDLVYSFIERYYQETITFGPKGQGDGHLSLAEWEEFPYVPINLDRTMRKLRKKGWTGTVHRSWARKPRVFSYRLEGLTPSDESSVLASILYNAGWSGSHVPTPNDIRKDAVKAAFGLNLVRGFSLDDGGRTWVKGSVKRSRPVFSPTETTQPRLARVEDAMSPEGGVLELKFSGSLSHQSESPECKLTEIYTL